MATVQVKGYKRRSKKGKVVSVKGYTKTWNGKKGADFGKFSHPFMAPEEPAPSQKELDEYRKKQYADVREFLGKFSPEMLRASGMVAETDAQWKARVAADKKRREENEWSPQKEAAARERRKKQAEALQQQQFAKKKPAQKKGGGFLSRLEKKLESFAKKHNIK